MLCHLIWVVFVTFISNLSTYADYVSRPEGNGQEIILCGKCGADIADTNYLFNKLSPGATKKENKKIFGKQNLTVQTLVNPFGVQFEIVTSEKARCENIGTDQRADTWFPGYNWRICACQHCGQHLGWTFKKSEYLQDQIESFNGLILRNILGENCSFHNISSESLASYGEAWSLLQDRYSWLRSFEGGLSPSPKNKMLPLYSPGTALCSVVDLNELMMSDSNRVTNSPIKLPKVYKM